MDSLAHRLIGDQVVVTALGMGCSAIGGLYALVSEEQAADVVARALSGGIRYFDTAPLYGYGRSEQRLGEALAGVARDSFAVSTKVGRVLLPGRSPAPRPEFDDPLPYTPVFDFSRDGAWRSIEGSLARLRLEYVDLVWIHDLDEAVQDNDHHLVAALEGTLPALGQMRDEAVVRAVGLASDTLAIIPRVLDQVRLDAVLLGGSFTLLDHAEALPVLERCRREGIGVVVGGPYASGILASGARPGARYRYAEADERVLARVRDIERVCARYGVPLAAVALQYIARHPAVSAVIPGLRSVAEVDQTLGYLDTQIPSALWETLSS